MKRKPPHGNVRRVRYINGNLRFALTNKAGHTVQCESFQERKLALLLERDSSVSDYISQPEVMTFTDAQGRTKTYTPDFLVKRVGSPDEIHEVTLNDRRERKPNLQEREAAARQICQSRGMVYKVFTEDVLPDDTETANLLAFYTARTSRCANATISQHVEAILHLHESYPFNALISQLVQETGIVQGNVHLTLKHLIWHGVLQIDWQRLVYLHTSVTGKRIASNAYVWLEASTEYDS